MSESGMRVSANQILMEVTSSLSKHDDQKLNDWIEKCRCQNLGAPGIMPSGVGFTDIVANIIAFLSTGKVMKRREDRLTKEDIAFKLRKFFDSYKVYITDDDIYGLIKALEKCQIIRPTKDPLHTYTINETVRDLMKDRELLTNEIVKRVVKHNVGRGFGPEYID